MAETKFVGRIDKFYVEGGFARLIMRATPEQLGRVIHLAAFTGGGDPRPFAVRVVAKDIPGLAWQGMLKRLTIDQAGQTFVDMLLDLGFDLDILAKMVDRNVAVEVKDIQ